MRSTKPKHFVTNFAMTILISERLVFRLNQNDKRGAMGLPFSGLG